MLAWLEPSTPFPDPSRALPEGLLAVGADLSVPRLRMAYTQGIFPWFNPGDPILWWSPDPRMVLECTNLKVARSLGKKLRQIARQETDSNPRVKVTINGAFEQVLAACAQPRHENSSTWISQDIQHAYTRWHHEGQVHSIETWIDDRLAGGLYGVWLGRFFFGESMFSRQTDASKIALAYLVQFLLANDVPYVDCQQETHHLASMGASPVSRPRFLELVANHVHKPAAPRPEGQLLYDGRLVRAHVNAP